MRNPAARSRSSRSTPMTPGCSTCAPANQRWRYDERGRLTDVTRLDDRGRPAETTTYRLYKQTRGNSLYTTVPASVVEQLRMTDRSRVEWELQGAIAHVRKA